MDESSNVIEAYNQWEWVTWWPNWKQKDSWKKNILKNLIWKSLKQTAINWNPYLGGVIRPGETIETYRCEVSGGQQKEERQTLKKQQKIHKILRDNLVSAQKAWTIQQKHLIYTDTHFSNAVQISYYAFFQLHLPLMW